MVLFNTAMNLRTPLRAQDFLTSWAKTSSSRRALLHAVEW